MKILYPKPVQRDDNGVVFCQTWKMPQTPALRPISLPHPRIDGIHSIQSPHIHDMLDKLTGPEPSLAHDRRAGPVPG